MVERETTGGLGYPRRRHPRAPGAAEPSADLHRLGIQAFEPVLIEGKAIQLAPAGLCGLQR